MKIAFILSDNYWQKKNIGSSRIRGRWVIKYLNKMLVGVPTREGHHDLNLERIQAEEFVQGKEYDVLVFQKVYWKEMARNFKGIKILDICDPDWLEGAEVVSFCSEVDAVTVPTEALKKSLSSYTDKPIFVVPDGEDFEILPPPKTHIGKAKSVVWFGYSGNSETIFPTFYTIKKLGLKLKIVSDGHINTSECDVENIKWEVDTCDQIYQTADFTILPDKSNGRFKFKSNNKTIHSWALGLPVAKTPQDMERFMDGEERQKEAELRYAEVKEKYNVAKSAEMLYNIIKEIKK